MTVGVGSGAGGNCCATYYGAPGINPQRETELFLVGKHFSVHETRVLVGNQNCEFSLISREVMRVLVPSGVQTVDEIIPGTNCFRKAVHVNLATPYGVTSNLSVPAVMPAACPLSAFAWSRTEIPMAVTYLTTPVPMQSIRTYTVPLTGILSSRPHSIAVRNPQFARPVSKPVLTYTVRFDDDHISQADVGVYEVRAVYDQEGQQYVIDGAAYATFLRQIIGDLPAFLNTNYPTDDPPSVMDLRITGQLNDDSGTARVTVGTVTGEVHILLRTGR